MSTYGLTVLDYNGVLFGEGTRSALASFAQTQVPDLATASSVASAAGPSAKERAVPWPPSHSCTGTCGAFIGGFDGGTFGYAALDCNGVLFGLLHAGADAGPGGGIIRGVSGCWTSTASSSAKGRDVPWPHSHKCRRRTSQELVRGISSKAGQQCAAFVAVHATRDRTVGPPRRADRRGFAPRPGALSRLRRGPSQHTPSMRRLRCGRLLRSASAALVAASGRVADSATAAAVADTVGCPITDFATTRDGAAWNCSGWP